ncbi:MAG: ADP-ribosylglycohydrolase family protein [Acidobacteria bacterium]|nr:MAG: ADP-ribosylglycohydrolase family protein [Acidobacteriota bacterium]
MLGVIAGDIIGSPYEGGHAPARGFPLFPPEARFTDDTVLAVAVAWAILEGRDYGEALRLWGRRYPHAGYGSAFLSWLSAEDPRPYGSFGDGSAMRVAPVGWAGCDLDEVIDEAGRSAAPTHDHPEGIRGAQATAGALFLARTGHNKAEVRAFLEQRFGYDLSASLEEVRARGAIRPICREAVPAAAICFLDARDFEDAVRKAVSLGGDTDTVAAIAGALAEAFHGGVPAPIQRESLARLPHPLRETAVRFARRFGVPLSLERAEKGTDRDGTGPRA